MKILIDECVPRKLKPLLRGHICRTASEAGFSGKKNGILLRLAEENGYDVLVTVDRGLETQQNLRGRKISVLILKGKSGRLKDLVPLVPDCLQALSNLAPGRVLKIEG
jgi:predicted nuclease of predicted toxin-antitoxin system